LASKISKTRVSKMIPLVLSIIGAVGTIVVVFVFSSTFSRESKLSRKDREIHELRQIISHMMEQLLQEVYLTPDTIDTIPLHYPGIDFLHSTLKCNT